MTSDGNARDDERAPAATEASDDPKPGWSRRRFITRVGAGAAAIAGGTVLTGHAPAAARARAAEHETDGSSSDEAATGSGDVASDPDLALGEIQGNVLAGFNKDHQGFVFLAFPSSGAGQAWLAAVAPTVASTREVAAFNDAFRASVSRAQSEESAPTATWVNVALSHSGLAHLDRPDDELGAFPPEFRSGMRARASVIGDTGASAPERWVDHFREDLDAVVIVAGDRSADVDAEIERQSARARDAGVQVVGVERGNARADEPGHEHFGFRDGVSQPGVRGFTPRENPDDEEQGIPGQDLLWPGEFVLGYAAQAGVGGGDSSGPIATSGPEWTRDGSYLVFRRLRQDVAGFRDFVRRASDASGMSEDLFGAKLVGRYKSGAPLSLAGAHDRDPGATDDALLARTRINDFEFAEDDPDGETVPLGAHIRKVYPRDAETPGGGEEETQRHRMLRRGIPFGPSLGVGDTNDPVDGDRGLHFLCYQTSIARQFEHVQARFVNDPDFPEPGAGQDPIIAQDPATGAFALPGGRTDHVALMQRFVVTTGGEYFFQPSLRALRLLAGSPIDEEEEAASGPDRRPPRRPDRPPRPGRPTGRGPRRNP